MREALFYESLPDGGVRCRLCNHFCRIPDGRTGRCGVRTARGGRLFSVVYGRVVAEHADPVEKKPLFHFLPGTRSYSIATAGCTFACPFCQNHEISQAVAMDRIPGVPRDPAEIAAAATAAGCASISYTYTEPTVFLEFALDVAALARRAGLRNIFVTNGYMSAEALRAAAPVLDAANVDLKGGEGFYRDLCRARRAPVVETIRLMRELGVWVEVTTLLIPGANDDETSVREAAETIRAISPDIPWHVSRFHPMFEMDDRPPTDPAAVRRARRIGLDAGLRHVYTGNLPGDDGETTFCASCGTPLLVRLGCSLVESRLRGGRCPSCGAVPAGVFSAGSGPSA